MWNKSGALIGLCLLGSTGWTLAQEAPQSAIPWLNEDISPVLATPEPPVSAGISSDIITEMPLEGPRRDGAGVLGSQVTGLPADTFARSDPDRLVALVKDIRPSDLPALQELVLVLLLAEVDPPAPGATPDGFLLARVDRLIALGALEQAQALLERAGPETPALFARWLDVSLLTGNDDAACAQMIASPGIAPSLPARVFCLSRSNDWAAAALTLETGTVLGAISDQDAGLLARFLDPEAFEGVPMLPPPDKMTPLYFRLLDGLGEPPDTQPLPVAYAVSDLRDTIGWKAQVEAAERLARAQAIGPAQLRALYTERMPAASGGVWDRVEAFQRFDVAFASGDPGAIANALPGAWAALSSAGLQVPFAELFGAGLTDLPLAPAAAQLATKVGLLSKSYEAVANAAETPRLPRDAFAIGVAKGAPGTPAGLGPIAQAIHAGFAAEGPPPIYASMVSDGRLGEALLIAIGLLQDGVQSDRGDIMATLALLRSVGLHDIARRAALQLLLLDRAQ